MDDVHLFAWMHAALTGPLDAGMAALIARLQAWIYPLEGGILAMLMMGVGYCYYRRPQSDFMANLFQCLGSYIIMAGLLYAPNYDRFIVQPFLHGVLDGATGAVAGGFGATGPGMTGAGAFDVSVNLNWASGARLWEGVSAIPGKSWLLGLVALASWAWAFLMAGVGWAMYEATYMILRVLLVFGPILCAFYPWETTRGWTKGWFNASATCVLSMIGIVIVLAFLVSVQGEFADRIMGTINGTGASTEWMATTVKLLAAQGVCSFLMTFVLYRICGITANIMHNHVAHAVDSFGARATQAAAGAAEKAVGAGRSAAGYTAAAGKAANANVRASGINATTSGTTPAGHAARMRQQAANNPTGPMVGAAYPWRSGGKSP